MPTEPVPFKSGDICYAGYPTAQVHESKSGKQITQLLWGDWIRCAADEADGWVAVRVRNHDGFMRTASLQRQRLLEIVFVDIGQGDGAFAVLPDGRLLLIDAGEEDNMLRFLKWRFAGFKKTITFDTAIITHPDQDHYKGFQPILDEPNIRIKQLLHNGIIEDSSSEGLGRFETLAGQRYVRELMLDETHLKTFLDDTARWNGKQYAKLLKTALDGGRVDSIRMLSTTSDTKTFVPGYDPSSTVRLQVLGPLLEKDSANLGILRWFKSGNKWDKGKTKNGHSVVVKLVYKNLRVLLGGDLNSAAEEFLITQYAQILSLPKTEEDWAPVRTHLRETFEVDVAKCCHHGSHDFVDGFLSCVHPIATVISSGDEESHAHPRSDTLGTIGKCSRGRRPLIFSTELARSTASKASATDTKELRSLRKKIDSMDAGPDRKKLEAQYQTKLDRVLGRFVSVYGAINLRSDGDKVVLAYRLEVERNNRGRVERWDLYELQPDPVSGELTFHP